MGNNLERFERLSRASKERMARRLTADAKAGDEQRARELAEEEARSLLSPEYTAGPPNGCHVCYAWRRGFKFGGWAWRHGEAIDPVTRPWSIWEDDEDPEPCEFCTHDCHGPDGEPLPIIALAAG